MENMRTNYQYFDINEQSNHGTKDGKPRSRFLYELNLQKNTNAILIGNFNKVAKWIEDNCPTLNKEFSCKHNPYYWIKLVVENGKAYFEYGSHGYDYDLAMSTTETAVFSRGSMQSNPYAFKGKQFASNERLEEFLRQWPSIKTLVTAAYKSQSNVYSVSFVA